MLNTLIYVQTLAKVLFKYDGTQCFPPEFSRYHKTLRVGFKDYGGSGRFNRYVFCFGLTMK